MTLKALSPIWNWVESKLVKPGELFETSGDAAQSLIRIGAAEEVVDAEPENPLLSGSVETTDLSV